MAENSYSVALFLFGYLQLVCTQNRMGFGGPTGLGGVNSATNLQPPPNVRPVGAGGAPNNPNMQAVQDPSQLRMSPFLGPAGEPSTQQQSQQQGEARSGDPLPFRPLSEREIIVNHINEQKIAATLPPLCTVPPSIQHMKVMPMPIPRGNPPENNARTGNTPPGGGPLLNRMMRVPGMQQVNNMASMHGNAVSNMNIASMNGRSASSMIMAQSAKNDMMNEMFGHQTGFAGHGMSQNSGRMGNNPPMLPIQVDANGPIQKRMVNSILKSQMKYKNGLMKIY